MGWRFFTRAVGTLTLAAQGAAKDPCECLDWKPLYETNQVLCGEGLELFGTGVFHGRTDVSLKEASLVHNMLGFTYYEFCQSFFKVMEHNKCVNVAIHARGEDSWYAGKQWCYVSSECKQLNGGHKVSDKLTFPQRAMQTAIDLGFGKEWLPYIAGVFENFYPPEWVPRNLSWKLCDQEKDSTFAQLKPQELLDLAAKQDSVVGFVTKMAYPRLMPPEFAWHNIKDIVSKGETEKMPVHLREAIGNNEAIVIDLDPEGHEDQRIIYGKEVYELENKCNAEVGCGRAAWPYRRGRDVGEL